MGSRQWAMGNGEEEVGAEGEPSPGGCAATLSPGERVGDSKTPSFALPHAPGCA
jgi:hypothetical protein